MPYPVQTEWSYNGCLYDIEAENPEAAQSISNLNLLMLTLRVFGKMLVFIPCRKAEEVEFQCW